MRYVLVKQWPNAILILVKSVFQGIVRHAIMASSLLKSGVAKAKKAKDHVEEGLEKVRAKPWATPLGKALQVREACSAHCKKRDVDTIHFR